ncbi:hypothetical protein ANANG_G00305810 [Anguilla anguilla]|uniref:N-terminal Ras-GEF domain-containing protein n=1 Tax=Anguilla anguilla TaxID=7936 RepID=A0A9D3LIT3_ANGAN|nr:hypothetical protein ANANG_G00305810 [Anguilla anguilla]
MGSSTLGKAASLDQLLDACIQAFDDNGGLANSQLPRTMLLMHRWYVTSTELAGKLLMIYPSQQARAKMAAHLSLRYCHSLLLALAPLHTGANRGHPAKVYVGEGWRRP